MKHTTLITLVLAAGLLYCGALWADTTITYQGRLDSAGQPHSGTVGMIFELYDQESGGAQQGPTLNESVQVTDGLFQAELDFGVQTYEAGRWLQITVNGQLLTPRQRITGAPFALRAPTSAMWAAVHADGTIVSQSGGISVQHADGNGFRRLKFPSSVQGRAVLATVTTCNILGTPCGEPGIKATACGGGAEGDCEDFDDTHVVVAPYIDGDQVNAAFYIAVL